MEEEHSWKLEHKTDGSIAATCIHYQAMFAVRARWDVDAWDIETDLLIEPYERIGSLSVEQALDLYHSVRPVIVAFLQTEEH